MLTALGLALAAAPALAQSSEAPEPSQNAMVNLIRILVAKGVLTQANGDDLLKQAQSEADQARAAAPIAAAPSAPAPGVIRVPYVPELVKNQIRDEVKAEVMQQAKDENWAQPNAMPDWLKRIEWSGDLRFRDEYDLYSKNNDFEVIDFATLNANGPFDINDLTNPTNFPFLNTRQDRLNLLSVRARLGMKVAVSDSVSVGIRLATGKDSSPVSTTQLLGGGFAKKDFWLDQAYVTLKPVSFAGLTFGRMPNPFFHTDIVYDDDLNFDGAAVALQQGDLLGRDLKVFATAGVFPLEYGAANFPTNDVGKSKNMAKWLYGAQFGAEWTFADLYRWKLAAAYYDFQNVQGALSEPCALYNGNKQCSSDQLRPAFMQKGNTLFLLRDIVPDPANPLNFAQPQFAGLSFDYNLVNLTTEFDAQIGSARHFLLQADFVRNIAYNARDICRLDPLGLPVSNVSASATLSVNPCSTRGPGDIKARFKSGPDAWMVRASFGDPQPRRLFAATKILSEASLEAP